MKIKVLIAAAALIFVIGIACSIFVLCSPSKSIVNIVRDGEVLYSFDLSKEENRSFVIEYGDSSNTVEIKDGKIRVSEAECPDKPACARAGSVPPQCLSCACPIT
ncbi:MAG: NusG domain II-containing protein [Ruminococcus sp.]|nr:NusG domain II-containing protein [Ruminococcus sp.]